MKRFVLIMSLAMSISAFAGYTYTITDGMDFGGLTLTGTQSLLMIGGGGALLDVSEHSLAVIQNTAPYNQMIYPSGGIEQLDVRGYAHLDFSGGEVYEIWVSSYATAVLSGGTIQRLKTSQLVGLQVDPYIEIICKDWNYNTVTKMLTGIWADDSTFAIQLVDVANYTPTIDDITFTIIPEPATMLLLGAGGLFLRHKHK
ncbi:MAG TPA: PEP-CTERM sorting domain-containing protein [Anaerohalosphaeraceae bacterium]|nr:PEP-CTERM sorting domain-containing protein [Anaerohalosphaeraceae bacterium]HOL88020.1 PEP-CTERM sorting domain-containing protein [Anaerohalosphaeraceae bacterium]HPP55268.1 PEP-CTERM sorting domain-containing protein [Anaerohalosphaeraceae bacterium]